jgi:hypothetical protein
MWVKITEVSLIVPKSSPQNDKHLIFEQKALAYFEEKAAIIHIFL